MLLLLLTLLLLFALLILLAPTLEWMLCCMLEFECGFCPFETTMRGGGGVCKRGVSNFCGISGGGGSGNDSGNEGVNSLR